MEGKEGKWQRPHLLMFVSLLGGCFGLDRFYQQQIAWGVLKMVTLGGAGIWYLVDVARYAYLAGRDQPA